EPVSCEEPTRISCCCLSSRRNSPMARSNSNHRSVIERSSKRGERSFGRPNKAVPHIFTLSLVCRVPQLARRVRQTVSEKSAPSALEAYTRRSEDAAKRDTTCECDFAGRHHQTRQPHGRGNPQKGWMAHHDQFASSKERKANTKTDF